MSNIAYTFAFGADSITLAVGQYRKVSIAGVDGKKTSKTGTAFLTINPNGTADYTNRRGEVTEGLTAKALIATYKTGINTLIIPGSLNAETVNMTAIGTPVLTDDVEEANTGEDRFEGYDVEHAEKVTASV